ncbi:MAG: protein kinase domain-containing protein [Gemmatimonadaceae bacterium]
MPHTPHTRLLELFERGSKVPPAQRAAFLTDACGGDEALRRELASLLEASDSASGYFDALAQEMIAPAYAAIVAPAGSAPEPTLLPQLQAALESAYRIERELAGGAMSRVFLAEEIKLGRKVVIKTLPPELAVSVSAERFRREIQVAAQLQHPHIVPLLTSDSAGSFLYYTMPFVPGETLRDRLARDGALPISDATGIWHDVLDALTHAHAKGVVHRDIKPANILLGGRNALVTDFGIARAIEAAAGDAQSTATGLTIGTPAYMAPEQVTGDRDADHRVDIYAAGLVMYEMLEGRSPFHGGSTRELLLARLTHDPPAVSRSDCPRELADLVARCLAKDPAARPDSADAVLAALDSLPARDERRTEKRPRERLVPLAYAAAALVLVAAAFGWTQTRQRRATVPVAAEAPEASIAVLPVVNLGADPRDSALTDGMTEELIATLSRVGNLRVIARTSVVALKDRGLDVRQIAESLRVSHVLEAGLQRVGPRLRMQVRLVDARDGSTTWSTTYDRNMDDIFAVQEDVSRAVASELDVRLVGAAMRGSARRRSRPNAAAYELYLRGMDLTLRGSREGLAQALAYFNRAIEADSSFAAAYAALVPLYILTPGDAPGDYSAWFARAEQAGLKAVALDDSLAEAHTALGWARMPLRKWAGAEASFKRAVALDPRMSRAHEGLARIYLYTGKPAAQLVAARHALDMDPFSDDAAREMALALNANGRCEEALRLLRPFKTVDPPFPPAGIIGGLCYARLQRWPEAIAEFRWTTENTVGRAALAFLGYAQARGGREDEARALLSDLLAGRKSSHGAFGIAIVYAGLRDYDRAFAWLDKAMDENSIRVYLFDPAFEDLHRDPRFPATMERMGNPRR